VKGRQTLLQPHVRFVGAADETHRTGAATVAAHRLFLGLAHPFAQRHAEVVVGVHLQERLVALAQQPVARSVTFRRRHDAANDALTALGRASFIDRRDFGVYWELYQSIAASVRPPDLMIQLRCPVRTLRKRIRARGRAMEQAIPANYLSRLNRLYYQWFDKYRLSPVITLETDQLDWLTDLVDRADLFRRLDKFL